MNNLEDIKKACEDNDLEFERFVHASFLTTELGKSFKPTVDMLDDLYCGLVGGVMYNLGSGKTPMIMEDIGPAAEDRNTLEFWENLRIELIYGLGGTAYPFEEWIKENKQSEDWVEIISSATKLDEEFKADPNKWCVDLREKCKSKK
jgi:hypothetical protein